MTADLARNGTATRLPTMYALSAEWDRLLALYEDADADPSEIDAELDKLAGDIAVKAEGVAIVLDALDRLTTWQADEAKRMAARAKATAANAERLRARVIQFMQGVGTDIIRTERYTLSVRKNPEAATVVDAALVPVAFKRQPPVPALAPDLNKIKAHYRATGKIVPGVEIMQGMRLEVL